MQPEKALPPIDVTFCGITTSRNAVLAKAERSIRLMPLPNFTVCNVEDAKAPIPIFVTLFGIVIDVFFPFKAPSPILTMPSFNVMYCKFVQPSKASFAISLALIVTDVNA